MVLHCFASTQNKTQVKRKVKFGFSGKPLFFVFIMTCVIFRAYAEELDLPPPDAEAPLVTETEKPSEQRLAQPLEEQPKVVPAEPSADAPPSSPAPSGTSPARVNQRAPFDNVPETPRGPIDGLHEEGMPKIEARTFEVTVLKRSKSKRVYLFEDGVDERPRVGRVVLLKRGFEPVMGVRVLKVYAEKRQFAARKVREYGALKDLEPSEKYTAVEKLSDILLVPAQVKPEELEEESPGPEEGIVPPSYLTPKDSMKSYASENQGEVVAPGASVNEQSSRDSFSEQDRIDMRELEYDHELDAETSPPPTRKNPETGEEMLDPVGEEPPPSDGQMGLMVDDPSAHLMPSYSVAFTLGYIRNSDPAGSFAYYTTGGVRLGLLFQKMPWMKGRKVQDAIYADFSLFGYRPFFSVTDYHTIIPMGAQLRYQIFLSETLSVFCYGGLYYNFDLPGSDASTETQAMLSGILPAGGAGIVYRIGPNWDVRFDFGLDYVGGGLMLSF